MKKIVCCLVATVMLVSLFLGCGAPSPAPSPAPAPAPSPAPSPIPAPTPVEPIVLKTVAFNVESHASVAGFVIFKDMINERAKGELVVEYIGAREAIPMFEQPEAVARGAVDACFNVGGVTKSFIPGINSMVLSEMTAWEEREVGYHDLMVEIHKKENLYYLGRQLMHLSFYMFSDTPFATPYDMSGQRFRSGGLYDPLYKKLGIVSVTIPLAEQYTALERGLVDGAASTAGSIDAFKLYEVCKYILSPPFYGAQNGYMMINLDKWNSIPKHLQDLMIEVQKEAEPLILEHYKKSDGEYYQKALDNGMVQVEWSPADTQWFLDTAYSVAWEEVMSDDPVDGAKMRDMLAK
ncbi:TRAP transporter substrate-binding protein DctP [Chloroflexota bacterium]